MHVGSIMWPDNLMQEQCSMGNCASFDVQPQQEHAPISHYTVSSLWLNGHNEHSCPCYTASWITFSGTLLTTGNNAYSIHRNMVMFFTDSLLLWFMRAIGSYSTQWLHVRASFYAAFNSCKIENYIYRNLWTLACRQWGWRLFHHQIWDLFLFTS